MNMKNILLFLLAFVAYSQAAAPVASDLIRGNIGQSIPLFGSSRSGEPKMGAEVFLDTSERDTSKYFYRLVDKPATGVLDTIGFVHFAYKDSTGSDSTRVKVIWYGNPQPDGLGVWSKIDSINQQGNAITTYTAVTPKAVINANAYMALMFTIENLSNSNVALKSAAKGVVLNRRQRIGSIGNF
jgi:hypothetical protein